MAKSRISPNIILMIHIVQYNREPSSQVLSGADKNAELKVGKAKLPDPLERMGFVTSMGKVKRGPLTKRSSVNKRLWDRE